MEIHPILFVLLAYVITAVVAVFVTFIIKTIAFFTREKPSGVEKPGPDS